MVLAVAVCISVAAHDIEARIGFLATRLSSIQRLADYFALFRNTLTEDRCASRRPWAIDSTFHTDAVVDTEVYLRRIRPFNPTAEISSKHYLGRCALEDPG
jgi:hypothetical protein